MNHPLKIVIVEDEPAASSQLQFLLGQIDIPVEVIHIIEGVEEGLAWFQQNTIPDLILSDIQLSDGVSFEIYEKIPLETPIIFTTAFDEYAIRAFKLNSIDYLLKPIDQEALTAAIQKFKNQQLYHYSQLQSLLAQQAFIAKNYRQSFLVKFRDKLIPIKAEDFAFFYIDQGIVYGQLLDGKKYSLEYKLEDLEQQLDPAYFVRANRQFILSRDCVVTIESYPHSRVNIQTQPKAPSDIVISKEKVTWFKKWLANEITIKA